MKEDDIFEVKLNLWKELISTDKSLLPKIPINNICDNIISNYIAFILLNDDNSVNTKFESFLIDAGNLSKTYIRLIDEKPEIKKILSKIQIINSPYDAYFIARLYENLKSCCFIENKNELQHKNSFEYRKSVGMFFTPSEIVKFIVKNTFEKKSSIIRNLLENGNFEQAAQLLLEIKVIDISCGTGSFLIESIYCLKELHEFLLSKIDINAVKNSNSREILFSKDKYLEHVFHNSIFGVDIDKNSILICKCSLLKEFSLTKKISPGNLKIIAGDSLTGPLSIKPENIDQNTRDILNTGIHWKSIFPEIFDRTNSGFDIIVMNPPYGKVRIESGKGHNINNGVSDEEREHLKTLSKYFRKCGEYSYSTSGVLNYYKLMLERAIRLLNNEGSIGFIVPNTLLCDQSTIKLREFLFNHMTTRMILELPEGSKFFPDVIQGYCIFITDSGDKTNETIFAGNILEKNQLYQKNINKINIDIIRKNFPMITVPITDQKGFQIFNKLAIITKISDIPNIKNSRGEVDLTTFSKIITDNSSMQRLIRGVDISQYKIDYSEKKPSFVNYEKFVEQMGESSKLIDITKQRIICKQIANQNKRKRLEFAIAPAGTILANSCNYIALINDKDPKILKYLLGVLNSSLIEWRFRITSTNNHINNYEIDDLPLIIPNLIDSKREIFENISFLVSNIKEKNETKQIDTIEAFIDALVFQLYDLNVDESMYVLSTLGKNSNYISSVKEKMEEKITINTDPLNGVKNHKTAPLSEMEMRMILSIPEGGNWKDIPDDIESKRVQQIKKTGGRTTYYGRLRWDNPAYTISTYFSRTGNGCFIHPKQDRLISLREGARLQSFMDDFTFYGTKTSMYYQIGNAVPPLLGRAIGEHVKVKNYVDLFCGAGGFSSGMELSGGKCQLALDHDKHCIETFKQNHQIEDEQVIGGDIRELNLRDLYSNLSNVGLVIGGPPCQGFSTAGKNILDDPRNELVKFFINSVDLIQPKTFIMENVKGLTFYKKGQVLREIHDAFEKIGYTTNHQILNAADYGVPQLRERVIIIGHLDGSTPTFPKTLFSKTEMHLPSHLTVRKAIDDLIPLNVGEGTMEITQYAKEPQSYYQELMRKMITFDEFYAKEIQDYKTNPQENKKKGLITLDQFL